MLMVQTKHPAAIQRLLYYPPLGEREADERILGIGVGPSRLIHKVLMAGSYRLRVIHHPSAR